MHACDLCDVWHFFIMSVAIKTYLKGNMIITEPALNNQRYSAKVFMIRHSRTRMGVMNILSGTLHGI